MKATKKAMREEAVKRMKMLQLDESIIEDFQKRKRVLVSDQQFVDFDPKSRGIYDITPLFPNYVTVNGRMYQIFTAAPSEESLQCVKDIEKRMGVLIYHIIRVELDNDEENDYCAVYAFLSVWKDDDDWEAERSVITRFSSVCGYHTLNGYPKSRVEFMEIPVKTFLGCLVEINAI